VIVDGRLELAPAARVAELAGDALCLGVTTPTGSGLLDALEATRAARAVRSGLPVIWGGPHASLLPEECLATGLVDACVIGPGERTFGEIVGALAEGGADQGVPGIAWLRDGEVVHSLPRPVEDVNHLPSPNYALLDLERHFRFRAARRLDFCTSRGMATVRPGTEAREASTWSGLTAERVVAEVAELVARHRILEVAFADRGFFTDSGRVEAIAARLIEVEAGVAWEAEGEAAAIGRVPPSLFTLLAESGCRRVRVWATAPHPVANETLLGVVRPLREAHIAVTVAFLAGHPADDSASLRGAYHAAKGLRRADPAIQTAIHLHKPYPEHAEGRSAKSSGSAPASLEDWARLGLEEDDGPWIPRAARREVARWNFYLHHAHQASGKTPARRLLRRLARARVAADFFAFDFERWAVSAARQAKVALGRRPASFPET
jgi:hypothetical protein